LTDTGYSLETILTQAGVSSRGVFITGYSNGYYGYLIPQKEMMAGNYETEGAAVWADLPQCCEQSERAVLDGFRRMAAENGAL